MGRGGLGEWMAAVAVAVVVVAVVLAGAGVASPVPSPTTAHYLHQREMMLEQERSTILGHDIVLTPEEDQLNQLLMAAKRAEMEDALETFNFPPSKNFMTVKSEIEASEVFQIIKLMPKGAALHVHSSALASVLWVVEEITYWPDLYMCYTPQDVLLLKFFQTPDSSCSWQPVSDARDSYPAPEEFDAELLKRLSYFTDKPDEVYTDINTAWAAFELYFISVDGLLSYRPAWERYLYQALLEFTKDNVLFVEYRCTDFMMYELNGTLLTHEEALLVHQNTAQRFLDDHPEDYFGTRVIYSPSRRVDNNTMEQRVSEAKQLIGQFPDYIAGFDLVGQEDKGAPLVGFVNSLVKLSEANIPVFYHAGETGWMGMNTDENLIDALLLNASRIGHGYAITKHPVAKMLARERDIPVEVSPISNQVLKLVDDLRHHPAAGLVAEGFPIVVSSDGPGAWGSKGLSYDVYEAFMAFGGAHADLRFLKQIAMNSIKYSSLKEDAKLDLMSRWAEKWEEFVISSLRVFNRAGFLFPESSTYEGECSSGNSFDFCSLS